MINCNYVPAVDFCGENESDNDVPDLAEAFNAIFARMKEIPELSHVDETWEVAVEQCEKLGVSIWDPETRKVAFGYHNHEFRLELHTRWGLECDDFYAK
jgi:hypothetical protein